MCVSVCVCIQFRFITDSNTFPIQMMVLRLQIATNGLNGIFIFHVYQKLRRVARYSIEGC